MDNENKNFNYENDSEDININENKNDEKSNETIFSLENNFSQTEDSPQEEEPFNLTSDFSFNKTQEDNELIQDGKNKKSKKNKPKRRKSKIIIFLCIILSVSILLATGMIVLFNDFLAIFKGDREIIVEIPSNSSATEISQMLGDEGVISFPFLFRVYAKFNNEDSSFKPGTHKLNTKMSYEQIIGQLQKTAQQEDAINVTIPEGYNLVQISKLLQEKGVVKSWKEFMDAFNRQSFNTKIEDNIPRDVMRFNQKEGYAFPDTYTFYLNEDTSSVSKRLLNNFSVKTDPIKTQIEEGMKKYNLTFDQIITLASIIQAESSDIQHMNQVAGVFHNRLKNSVSFPKLQSDPTTLYSKNVIGALSDVQNQKMLDAYDTYTGVGLPPSAICSPGVRRLPAGQCCG
ncbi:MAG: endolytic transglycosylase MltG, partial [Oscillospiraceae bacterium]